MDIIADFARATEPWPMADAARIWAGASVVAASLNRSIFTSIMADLPLFGNLFIVMAGSSGSGKSLLVNAARRMALTQKHIKFGDNKTTSPGFFQSLGAQFPDKEESHSGVKSYFVCNTEIGSWLPDANTEFMQDLADLWDCPEFWSKLTKTQGVNQLFKPYLNILLGAQPSWINQTIRQEQLELGLPSRILFIEVEPLGAPELFGGGGVLEAIDALAPQLDALRQFKGFVPFDNKAKDALRRFQRETIGPSDQGMVAYNQRRHLNVAKIAMLLAVSTHPDRQVITFPDVERASQMVLSIEPGMERVLRCAGGNPYRIREDAALRALGATQEIAKKAWSERSLRELLSRSIPSHHIGMVVESLIARGAVEIVTDPAVKAPNRRMRVVSR